MSDTSVPPDSHAGVAQSSLEGVDAPVGRIVGPAPVGGHATRFVIENGRWVVRPWLGESKPEKSGTDR